MPKILITGNGFDLNFRLPTSYTDFIKILNFIENNKKTDFDSIFSATDKLQSIKEYYKPFEFDIKKIELLKEEVSNNLWYQFFKKEYHIESWIDFESKIEYVLTLLFNSLEYIRRHIFSSGSIHKSGLSLFKPYVLDNNIEMIEVLKSFKIISENQYTDLLFNTNFLTEKYDFFIDINEEKISNMLKSEIITFKKIFNYYFEIFVLPFYENIITSIDSSSFSRIEKHFTFNYTPTFDLLFGGNKTNYLHGRIDSSANNIVLGINEVPTDALNKKYFLPFTKYFQKLDNCTDYNFIKEYDSRKKSNYSFFFFGHSLDKSDEDYINEVFNFVNKLTSKRNKIIIIYHNENSKSQLLINLLDIRGKDDILNLMKSNVLIFVKSNSTELDKELNKDISRKPRYSANAL